MPIVLISSVFGIVLLIGLYRFPGWGRPSGRRIGRAATSGDDRGTPAPRDDATGQASSCVEGPWAVIVLDAEGVCQRATVAAATLWGPTVRPEDLAGRSWRTLLAPADHAVLGAALAHGPSPGITQLARPLRLWRSMGDRSSPGPSVWLQLTADPAARLWWVTLNAVAGEEHAPQEGATTPPRHAAPSSVLLQRRPERQATEFPCHAQGLCPYDQADGTGPDGTRLVESRRVLLATFSAGIRPVVQRLIGVREHLDLVARPQGRDVSCVAVMDQSQRLASALDEFHAWMRPLLRYTAFETGGTIPRPLSCPLQGILARVGTVWQQHAEGERREGPPRSDLLGAPDPRDELPSLRLPLDAPWVQTDPDLAMAVIHSLVLAAALASPPGGVLRVRLLPDAAAGRIWVAIEDEGPPLRPDRDLLDAQNPTHDGLHAVRRDPSRPLTPSAALAIPTALAAARVLGVMVRPQPHPDDPERVLWALALPVVPPMA